MHTFLEYLDSAGCNVYLHVMITAPPGTKRLRHCHMVVYKKTKPQFHFWNINVIRLAVLGTQQVLVDNEINRFRKCNIAFLSGSQQLRWQL